MRLNSCLEASRKRNTYIDQKTQILLLTSSVHCFSQFKRLADRSARRCIPENGLNEEHNILTM